jgi:hypothetical protein
LAQCGFAAGTRRNSASAFCDVDQPVISAQLVDGRDRPQVRRVLKALDRPPFDLGALDGVQLRAQSVALGLGLA